jgi:PAS domain-containing protein
MSSFLPQTRTNDCRIVGERIGRMIGCDADPYASQSWTRQVSMNAATRYALGIVLGVFAVVVRVWLTPVLGNRTPYITVFATLMFAARYFGLGPSILTVTTSLFGLWFWLLAPGQTSLDRSEAYSLVAFLVFSGVIIAFGETIRRSKAKQDQIERALRESEARLKRGMQDMQNEIERRTAELEQKTAETVEQARLLDLANDAIFVRNSDDRISYWNEGAERLYG